MKKTLHSNQPDEEKDPILQKMLGESIELSDSQKKWFLQYNAFQQKQEEQLLYLMEEILAEEIPKEEIPKEKSIIQFFEIKEPEELEELEEEFVFSMPYSPSEVRPIFAFYGAEEPQLNVKLGTLNEQLTQHKYNFNVGQEIQFYCSLAQEGYLFVFQEEIQDKTRNNVKFIAPDEDSIMKERNSFLKSDFEKLPAMANFFNLFNYVFDQKGHFYWRVCATPKIPWDKETIEKKDLLSWLDKLYQEANPSFIFLEINVL